MKKMVDHVGQSAAPLANHAERHRAGKRVATALVECCSDHLVIARIARTQHMRWSDQGDFNVLHVRAPCFNKRLAQEPIVA